MANLSITATCNRNCTYCFARDLFARREQPIANMSPETFEHALDFLERSNIDQARLLGGEPTLHPDFPWFAAKVVDRGLRLLVFSNGLMPQAALQCLARMSDERTAVLVNVNSPEEWKAGEHEQQVATFQRLGPKVTLGFNINTPGAQLDFLLALIRQFGLSTSVRLGLAHPCWPGTNEFLHPRYYLEVGRRVAEFAAQAREVGVKVEFDCGFVSCMFPRDSLEILGEGAQDLGQRCSPVLDILPDGQVASCYPLASLHQEPLPDHYDAAWLRARFEDRLQPYRRVGVFRECVACPLREDGQCVGGCLAASMQRLRRTSCEVELPQNATTFGLRGKLAMDEDHSANGSSTNRWVAPYVDQPLAFWEKLYQDFGGFVKAVYLPLPGGPLGSGRPLQSSEYLYEFLRGSPFPASVLANSMLLPQPVEEVAPVVIEALRKLHGEIGLAGATVANLQLAARIREALPDLSITASVLMDIAQPNQVLMIEGICDTLVPASRVMRDLPALQALREAFSGRIRLIVNEGCLAGCPFRVQHFYEMGGASDNPRSLCNELLARHPWMRLTGAFVLPQHLHLYDGVYDELKLSGRVTLKDAEHYRRVLGAYIHRQPLLANEIGGGAASVLEPITISEEFFTHTLTCNRRCGECQRCPEYYDMARRELRSGRGQ